MQTKILNPSAFLAVLFLTAMVFLLPAGQFSGKTALGASDFSLVYELGNGVSNPLLALKKTFSCRLRALGICDGPDNNTPYTGGPHKDTSQPVGDGLDSHHCPAKSCYQNATLGMQDGPAIKMDPADHRQTSSYGNSAEAQAYRAEQQRLINEGKVREAIQMDIDDIRRIENEIGQPGKYDSAIREMLDYSDSLNPNDFINQ